MGDDRETAEKLLVQLKNALNLTILSIWVTAKKILEEDAGLDKIEGCWKEILTPVTGKKNLEKKIQNKNKKENKNIKEDKNPETNKIVNLEEAWIFWSDALDEKLKPVMENKIKNFIKSLLTNISQFSKTLFIDKKENLSDDTKRLIEMSFVVMSSKKNSLSFIQCFESCVHEYYLKRIENQDENNNSLSKDKIIKISTAIYKQFHN